MKAREVYEGSNGAKTTEYYRGLVKLGPPGVLAKFLFRAQKASYRAKRYGRTAYRDMSYDRKEESLNELCQVLGSHGAKLGISFGWKIDKNASGPAKWVLYVDLPNGQVSFHSVERLAGPDYQSDWDYSRASAERILAYCDKVTGAMNGFQRGSGSNLSGISSERSSEDSEGEDL